MSVLLENPIELVAQYVAPLITHPVSSNVILVTQASQLAGALSSIITYRIDANIDMGTQSITVPQGGLTLVGNGFLVSSLFSSEDNYTMFIDDGVFGGNLFITGMTISTTGLLSTTFDLDNDGNFAAVEWNDVNFQNCVNMGCMDAYRQGLARNVAFFISSPPNPITHGFEMDGAWLGGFAIIDTILLGWPAKTMFIAGPTLSISGSIRSNVNALSIDDAATVFDFAPSNFVNDNSFNLSGFRANNDADAVPNFPPGNNKAAFSNCTGIGNTHRGGVWVMSTQAATVISTIGTAVQVAGTTTGSVLAHYTHANNSLTLAAAETIDCDIIGAMTVAGSEDNQIVLTLRHWDNSASAYVDIGSYNAHFPAASGQNDPGTQSVSVFAEVVMAINDRIEIWVENSTSTDNVTIQNGSRLKLTRRPS